jgi:hypothetical protein
MISDPIMAMKIDRPVIPSDWKIMIVARMQVTMNTATVAHVQTLAVSFVKCFQ